MTHEEFLELGHCAVGLWPAWAPTDEQKAAWYAALKRRTLADAKAALYAGYTESKWREPNLPDVLAGLPKLPLNYAATVDEQKGRLLIEADIARRRAAAGLPSRPPKRVAPLAEQAAIVREAAKRARQMVGELQQYFDQAVERAAEKQRRDLQPALDEVRKLASETLAMMEALALDMRAAAFSEDEIDEVAADAAV